MKLYFNPQSRAVIARWMLDECGADYQIVPIDLSMEENKRAAYLKINPAGKLPALVDGEARIFENVAICLYLGRPLPRGEPRAEDRRARARPLSRVDGLLDVPARPRDGGRDARREDGAAARLDRPRDLQDRGRTRARRWTLPVGRLVHGRRRDDRLDVHLAADDGEHVGPAGDRRVRRSPARAPEGDQARRMS